MEALQYATSNQIITEEIKEEIFKSTQKQMSGKCNDQKPMEGNKRNSKRKVYSNIILHQETRKISSKQPNPTPKAIRKE